MTAAQHRQPTALAESLFTDEVRLAMAWNGGVSLAVWMGGAAVELDCARRAHLGAEVDGHGKRRAVYNALLAAFDRRLRIDVVAGASAGGLNGALLAGAITAGRRLNPEFLRKRWLDLGDFSDLLRPTADFKPASLMQGELFRKRLITTLRALLGRPDEDLGDSDLEDETMPTPEDLALTEPLESQRQANGGEPPRDDVVLEVQMTDVTGRQRAFRDAWGQVLYAREYRAPVRFATRDQYRVLPLATAARASSSFPAAFEPQEIDGRTAELAGLAGKKRWAVDGGLLENAPIKAALDLIPMLGSDRLVRRVLCYVNAAPSPQESDPAETAEPSLRSVLGYVVDLPRVAREVDQLNAIKRAVEAGESTDSAVGSLLSLERGSLLDTARHLLPTYRRSRTLRSLEELVGEEATPIFDRIRDEGPLPWLPYDVKALDQAGRWRWGFRAAQRVLLLELDLIAGGLEPSDDGETPSFSADQVAVVRDARRAIYRELGEIEAARRSFLENPAILGAARGLLTAPRPQDGLDALDEEMDAQGFRRRVVDALGAGTRAFRQALGVIETQGAADVWPATKAVLFGPGDDDGHFLETALAIEVVRRAFSPEQDLESAQTLSFAQLTPYVPCKVMTATPFRSDGPATSEQKLLGVLLGHFGGFYRRSWRANDFMWGRLDGAARIVDLLVGVKRGRSPALELGVDAGARWRRLAEALVPQDGPAAPDFRRLAEEALDDAAVWAAGAEGVRDAGGSPALELSAETMEILRTRTFAESPTALLESLARVIGDDAKRTGVFTRAVCARAVQYEILQEELGPLLEAARADFRAGAYATSLDWTAADSPWNALAELRKYRRKGHSLPERLGRFSAEESASTLAMRTLSHAALVTLAALPAATLPLARVFAVARPPFLSIFGISAKGWLPRVAVIAAFAAGSMYLAARAITVAPGRAPGGGYRVGLGTLWSLPTLVAWTAALVALGVVIVPAWRGMRSHGWRRAVHLGAAAALAALSTVVAVWLSAAEFGFAAAVTGPGAFEPPDWALWLVLSVTLGWPLIVRHLPVPGPVQSWVASRSGSVTRILTTSLTALATAGILIRYSARPLARHLSDGDWRTAAASCAFAGIAVCSAYFLFVPFRGKVAARAAARKAAESGSAAVARRQ